MGRIKSQNWDVNSLCSEFLSKKYMINMGAGKLSKKYNVSKSTVYEARELSKTKLNKRINRKLPKILILDIETAPLKAFVWGIWKQNVYNDQLISNWFMLTWSAKWLGTQEVMCDKLTGKEALLQQDKRIVISLAKLLDEADMIVAHNGKGFDIPKVKARMLINDLIPVTPYQQIDTLLVARKEFGFVSNKLNDLAELFGFGNKIDTDMQLWVDCYNGDESALQRMETYNVQDVELLESIYMKMRPWIKAHPNVGLFVETDVPVCPVCGSHELTWKGHYFTMTGRYETFQCKCGAQGRKRQSNFDKEKRHNLTVSLAR